jgi:hypothetical protein
VRLIIATTIATSVALTPLLAADNEPAKRLDEAAAVFSEIMAAPDKGIPQELLEKAHCIVIVPELKTAAFGFGGKYGNPSSRRGEKPTPAHHGASLRKVAYQPVVIDRMLLKNPETTTIRTCTRTNAIKSIVTTK